jgi:hypothetical protein
MINRTTTAAIAATLFLSGGTAAHAVDFVFTVPVELRSMPLEVEALRVTCNIKAADGALLGDGRTTQRLTDHGFNGEIRVEVTRRAGEKRPVTQWNCLLTVGANIADNSVTYGSRPGSNLLHPILAAAKAPNIEPRAGTTVVLEVSGKFR